MIRRIAICFAALALFLWGRAFIKAFPIAIIDSPSTAQEEARPEPVRIRTRLPVARPVVASLAGALPLHIAPISTPVEMPTPAPTPMTMPKSQSASHPGFWSTAPPSLQNRTPEERQELAESLMHAQQAMMQGDFEQAYNSFQAVLDIDPQNPAALQGIRAADHAIDQGPPTAAPPQ